MHVVFTCGCGARFRVPDNSVGKSVRCRECGEVTRLTEESVMRSGRGADAPSSSVPVPSKAAAAKGTPPKSGSRTVLVGVAAVIGCAVLGWVFLGSGTGAQDDDRTETASRETGESGAGTRTDADSTPKSPGTDVVAVNSGENPPTVIESDDLEPDLVELDPGEEPMTTASLDETSDPSSDDPTSGTVTDDDPTTATEPTAVAEAPSTPPPTGGATAVSAPSDTKPVSRTKAEVLAHIDKIGRTPPDWFEGTPLDFPQTLDLSWPEKPGGAWNNQKNVGQYIWDVVNPNPGRWRQGVRLMHHLLSVHGRNPVLAQKVMLELGRMYHELLQDHARAAFWFQNAGIGKGGKGDGQKHGAHLAECYWRLGNRAMAVELLDGLPLTLQSIKLWGDMGDTAKSVKLAEAAAPRLRWPAQGHLLAGDAHRTAGDFRKALASYRRAEQLAQKPDHAKEDKLRLRAVANIAAIQAAELLDLSKVGDGRYKASSIGYEGPIEVEVTVGGGRIEEVRVVKHREKQFYSSIEDTTRKIVEQQGVNGVDATSGATITSEAIINATAKALAAAMGR